MFLVDVDNTLLDNDAAKADLTARVASQLGPSDAARFWSTYELHVCQGHYAHAYAHRALPQPDRTVDSIAALRYLKKEELADGAVAIR